MGTIWAPSHQLLWLKLLWFILCEFAEFTLDAIFHSKYTQRERMREREGSRGHAVGPVPTAALNNVWKWFVMFSLELKLNLEVRRQSTKPQCWDSWNRKQLSPEEALAGFGWGDSPQKPLLRLSLSTVKHWTSKSYAYNQAGRGKFTWRNPFSWQHTGFHWTEEEAMRGALHLLEFCLLCLWPRHRAHCSFHRKLKCIKRSASTTQRQQY